MLKQAIGVKLVPVFDKAREAITGLLTGLASGKPPAWLSALAKQLAPLTKVFRESFAQLKASAGPALDSLKTAFEQLKPVLEPAVKGIAIVVGHTVTVASGFVNGLLRAVGGIVQAIGGIVSVVAGFFNLIVGLLTGNKAKVKSATEAIKKGIVNVFSGLWNAVKGYFTGFASGVLGVLGSLPGKAGEQARAIVDGIKRGIAERWADLVGWFERKLGALLDGFKRVFGIRSPSRVFRDLGKQIPAGLALGISSATGLVERAVGGKMAVPSAVRPAYAAAGAPARQEVRIYIDGRELDRALARLEQRKTRTGAW
jgi:phage-related protein